MKKKKKNSSQIKIENYPCKSRYHFMCIPYKNCVPNKQNEKNNYPNRIMGN